LAAGQRILILPSGQSAGSDAGQQVQASWQAGDWAQVEALASGPHREIAQRINTEAPTEPALADPSDLSAIASVLEESRDLRAAIAALLADPVPRLQESAE
jgi:hypothetical protein